jgi:hypothetical protein
MNQNSDQDAIITYIATWDETEGPTIVDVYPKSKSIDLDNTTLQIFTGFQAVFGNSADVSFDKTKLTIPLKSIKKVAKILMDSKPHSEIRGGRLPIVSIILLPIEFPENQLLIFNTIQEEILQQYSNEKKLSLGDMHYQIMNAIIIHAQKLNEESEQAFKAKDYLKATESSESSVNLCEILNMPDKLLEYRSNLEKAQIKKAQFLMTQAQSLIMKNKNEDAIKFIHEAYATAQKTRLNPIIQNVNKKQNEIYQISISKLLTTANQAILIKEWNDAEAYFLRAMELAKDPNITNKKLGKTTQKKLSTFYQTWADSIRSLAKKIVAQHDYRLAHQQYSEALKIAKRSKDAKYVQKIEVEFAKIPNDN